MTKPGCTKTDEQGLETLADTRTESLQKWTTFRLPQKQASISHQATVNEVMRTHM